MGAATGDSDGKIAGSESDKLLIEIVHLSVKRVKKLPLWTVHSDYTTKLFISGEMGKLFFTPKRSGTARLIDKVLSGRRECYTWLMSFHQI
jgi:hypothetical protein